MPRPAPDLSLSDMLGLYFVLPVAVSGVYGMNIPLPFQRKKWSFHAYLLLCLTWVVFVAHLTRPRQPPAENDELDELDGDAE